MAKKTIYDLKDEIANEIEEEVIEEVVVVKAPVQPTSFKSLKAAKAYAKANGGTVKEKGKFFYVR
tara:strand:- start:139 stop:333 length:195 start_codon:yes stop_codon:yes gene_type:complete